MFPVLFTNLEISPHTLIDDVLSVLQILQMIRSYFLLVTNNVLYLLSQSLLHLGVVDQTEDDDAEGGGGGVEASEEEEDGGGNEADFKIFLGEEKILVILVQLFNEDINDVIPLCSSGPQNKNKKSNKDKSNFLYLLLAIVFLTMFTKK